jgi:hypothetical protein
VATFIAKVHFVEMCVWALVSEEITQHMSLAEKPSTKQWMFSMRDSLNRDEFMKMVITLWAVLYAQQRLIHEGDHQSPLCTMLFVRSFLNDLISAPRSGNKQ